MWGVCTKAFAHPLTSELPSSGADPLHKGFSRSRQIYFHLGPAGARETPISMAPDEFSDFISDLVEFISTFEGIQERHRMFLLGFIEQRASEYMNPRGPSLEQRALHAALKKAQRTAYARNVTDTERRLMIRDMLSPYLKVASIPANGTAKQDVGVSTTQAQTSNGTARTPRKTQPTEIR